MNTVLGEPVVIGEVFMETGVGNRTVEHQGKRSAT
jgi:hypothetical protein